MKPSTSARTRCGGRLGWVTLGLRKGSGLLMASQLDYAGGTFVEGLVGDAEETFQVADVAVESPRRLVIAFVGLAFVKRQ